MAEIVVKLVNGELAGKTAQSIAKDVSAAALAYKKATVGTQEWVDASKKLDDVKQVQADLKKQTEGLATASDFLKQSWDKLPGSQYFNQVVQSFGLMKQGVGGLVSQFGVLKLSIAATGIGLLVIAFGTLYTWFKKTDDGATSLDGIFRAIGAIINVLVTKVLDFGKFLFAAFNNPKQAIKDLIQFIGDNLLNRVKSFGVILKGILDLDFKKVTDGFIQMQTGVTNATDKATKLTKELADAAAAGYRLAQVFDDLDERERNLGVLSKKAQTDIDQLLLKSKNRLKTEQERIDFLKQASALELEDYNRKKKYEEDFLQGKIDEALLTTKFTKQEFEEYLELNLNKEKLDDNHLVQLEKLSKKTNELSDADLTTIRQQQEKVEDIRGESIKVQEKITNREDALLKQMADERNRDIAKRKAQEEKKKAIREKAQQEELDAAHNIEDLKLALEDEGLQKEIDSINLETKRKIEAIKGSDKQIMEQALLLEDEQAKLIQQAKDKYAKEEADKTKAKADKEVTDLKAKLDKEIGLIEDHANHENFLLLQKLADGNITRNQFDIQAEENKKQAYENELKFLEDQGQKETALYEEIATKIIDIDQNKEDKIKNGRQATFNATVSFGQALLGSQIANIDRENAAGEARLSEIEKRAGKESVQYKVAQEELLKTQRDNFEKKKRLEKSQIKINALAEIAGIIKSAVEIGGVYGAVVGAMLGAATLIRANSAIQEVNAQSFKYGGIPDGVLNGPSHEQGGIPLVAEGDEIIMTKGVFRNPTLRKMASDINVAGGGRKFAAGGPTNPFQDRPPVSSGKSSPKPLSNQSADEMPAWVPELIAAQDRKIARLKVFNVVSAPDKSGYQDQINILNGIKEKADV